MIFLESSFSITFLFLTDWIKDFASSIEKPLKLGSIFETDEYETGDSESDMQEDIMRADFDGE